MTGNICSRLVLVLCLTLASALFGGAARAAAPIEAGDWEYTMKMKIDMKGIGIPIPAMSNTFTGCLDAKDPAVETPEMKKAGCKMINKKISDNRLSYTGRCVQGDSVTDTNYRMTYTGTSMKGDFDQVRKVGGKVQSTAKGAMSGKRLGPCKK